MMTKVRDAGTGVHSGVTAPCPLKGGNVGTGALHITVS